MLFRTALLALAALLTACVARVDDHAHAAPIECAGDPSDCAIAVHEDKVGPLSAACQETVRATTVTMVASADMASRCTTPGVLGCTTNYTAEGAQAWVRNDSERQVTAVHELLHVALRCSRGTFDTAHTSYGSAWLAVDGE